MTLTIPLRRTILHFLHRRLTEACTFMYHRHTQRIMINSIAQPVKGKLAT
jgi:hypothetical protein